MSAKVHDPITPGEILPTEFLANAPGSYARLSPPAPPSELDACERDLKVALPAELRRLLLVSNGAVGSDADGTFHREAHGPGVFVLCD